MEYVYLVAVSLICAFLESKLGIELLFPFPRHAGNKSHKTHAPSVNTRTPALVNMS